MAATPDDDATTPPVYASAAELAARKEGLGTSISVCLPARDEAATIGAIIERIRAELVDDAGLVDEIVVMDDGSTDATAAIATAAGARVEAVATVVPDVAAGSGKGNALWSSLYACDGDIVCWLDADIRDFGTHFVTRLIAPLLSEPGIGFVKGFYRRPIGSSSTGGGRVTELMARPILSALFPHLTHFVQPLSGEYAGRRALLETVPFVEGYGVELGLLVDLVAQFGEDALAQVDLEVRVHRNRPLDQLGPQAMAILVTGLRRAGIPVDRRLAELVRYDDTQHEERVPIEIRERPPMITVPAYRAKFERELSA